MDGLRIYQFCHNDACDAQQRVVVATGRSHAIEAFMSNYCGVYSDTWTQKMSVDGQVLIVIEAGNGQHRHVEWQIDEYEIAPGLVI